MPRYIAVDAGGNVYVSGLFSDNVFWIATPGTCSTTGTPCTISEIIDASGDGSNVLDGPLGLAVDASDNVYVTGSSSGNAFKIDAPGLPPPVPALSPLGLGALVALIIAGATTRMSRDPG